MIYGIGHDLVDTNRIENLLNQYGQKIADRILSKREKNAYINCKSKVSFIAKRFAAKEAFSKACGTGLRHPVIMTYITVLNDELGKPFFYFEEKLQHWLELRKITQYHLSLTDEKHYTSAFVILESI